jgi:hypothetical protein
MELGSRRALTSTLDQAADTAAAALPSNAAA